MKQLSHYKIIVRGRVQGVGFRYSVLNMAKRFGLNGYVRNMYDGSVMMEVEGPEKSTDEMIHWCKSPSVPGHVEAIEISECTVANYKSFEVRY